MKHKNIAIFIPHVGCPNQCSFCNQHTISGSAAAPTVEQVEKILIDATNSIFDKSSTEIAFFGGSFTAINHDYMISLLEIANKYVGENGFSGIRISTRPDCISQGILELLKQYNVTAIELGAQSMDDNVLKLNKRGHTAIDVVTASNLIKHYNFTLGLQMMVGLYGDTAELSKKTCESIIALKPDTVRLYPTVILKDTDLAEKYINNEYVPMSIEVAVQLCAELLYRFETSGIRVIKLGLHASNEVEINMVGGIYHPAFRELCEGVLYFNMALDELQKYNCCTAEIYVNPTCISKMVGQKKINIVKLAKLGYFVKVLSDDNISPYKMQLFAGKDV